MTCLIDVGGIATLEGQVDEVRRIHITKTNDTVVDNFLI